MSEGPARTGDAAALIVHDLKNELGALEERLRQLALQHDDPACTAAHAHCEQLRERFVQYLMVHGHDRGLVAHAVDDAPAALLAQLAQTWQSRWPALQVRVAGGAPPFAFYDPRLVRLALDAALHNACRHARQRVTLRARADAGGLRFQVDDDGPGPAPSSGAAPATTAGATGLGLALCDRVAQAHRLGQATGSSHLVATPGGCRFELCLP